MFSQNTNSLPFSFYEICAHTWSLGKTLFFKLFWLFLFCMLPYVLLTTMMPVSGHLSTHYFFWILSRSLKWLLSLFGLLVACHQVVQLWRGQPVSLITSLYAMLIRFGSLIAAKFILWLPLLMAFLAVAYMVFVWILMALHGVITLTFLSKGVNISLLIALLVMLIFFPVGIYLAVRATLCLPLAAAHRLSFFELLQQSRACVAGHWWWAAGILSLAGIGYAGVWILAEIGKLLLYLGVGHTHNLTLVDTLWEVFMQLGVTSAIQVFVAALLVVLLEDLRRRKILS